MPTPLIMRTAFVALVASISFAAHSIAQTLRIDVPAGGLIAALETLAKQADIDIVYQREQLKDLQTAGVTGDLSPREAVIKLIEGTALQLLTDEASGALLITALPKDAADVSTSTRSDFAGPSSEVSSETSAAAQEQRTELDIPDILVTGSHIRRSPQETNVNPVTVFTREDIDRSGAVNIVDFLGRITQSNNNVTDRVLTDEPVSGRARVNLRSLGNNTTLVLINGRRVTRTGRGFGLDDYDFNTIPIASIERIEVLTNSASAIYGADAIGGVINIITRQEYTGAEVSTQYGNTFDSDVSEKNVNLILGQQGRILDGRHGYAITFNASAYEQNSLAAADRPYTASSDYSPSGGRPLAPVNPTSRIAGAGRVFVPGFGPFPDTLPGLGVSEVAIPAGQDGRSLTLADFDPSAPIVSAQTQIPDYGLLIAPISQRSAGFSGKVELVEDQEFFVEGAYSRHRTHTLGLPPSSNRPIPVPASNPFNPFGVDVFVNKVFYELGPSRTETDNSTQRLAAGFRGGLFGMDGWRYDFSSNYDRNVGEIKRPVPATIEFEQYSFAAPDSEDYEVITPPGYYAINETDPARALNLFGDARSTQPNDPQLMRSLLGADESRETGQTFGGALTIEGALARLPGGPLKLAVGGDYRRDKVELYQRSEVGRLYRGLTGFKSQDVRAEQQYSAAAFAELMVPVVGEHQGMTGIESLQLSLAGRFDKASLVADSEEFTPKVGLLWKPFAELALRTSYSRGFKPPSILSLLAPTDEVFTFLDIVDPVTGQPVGLVEIRNGGNPDLKSERSSSWSAGLVYEPTWLRNLSVSVDYFDIDYTDKVIGPREDIVLEFFPERVERDPATNAVTSIFIGAVNLDSTKARGFDLKALYRTRQTTHGAFDAALNYTYNITNTERGPPGSPVFERVGDTVPRVQANATLFWSFRGYEMGPTVTYESSVSNERNLFGGAVSPTRVRHAVLVDFQGSIDFDAVRLFAPGTQWLKSLKLTAGIQNVFDREPSHTNGEGGWAKVDPRQRRYYLSVRKAF